MRNFIKARSNTVCMGVVSYWMSLYRLTLEWAEFAMSRNVQLHVPDVAFLSIHVKIFMN